jgi:hypothetical protein
MRAVAVLLALVFATGAEAKVPLRDEAHINGQLLAAQIGDILRKTCPDAGARYIVVYRKINALKAYARDKGYTVEEVEAFLDDRSEKSRIRGQAEQYLAEAGAMKGDVECYCRVARDEVRRGTVTGEMPWVSE